MGKPAFIIVENCLVKFATSAVVILFLKEVKVARISSCFGLMLITTNPLPRTRRAAILASCASTSPVTTLPSTPRALYINLFTSTFHKPCEFIGNKTVVHSNVHSYFSFFDERCKGRFQSIHSNIC